MPIEFLCLLSSAESSRPSDQRDKCEVKGCIYLRENADTRACAYHVRFFAYPMSLVDRSLGPIDLYKSKDAAQHWWPIYSLQPAREVFWKPRLLVVRNFVLQNQRDPLRHSDWGAVEMERRVLRAWQDEKSRPGKPNRLTTAEVLMPEGGKLKTIAPTLSENPRTYRMADQTPRAIAGATVPGTPAANHNGTGAFILWKGYGKKKIRKVQRQRPQGWHGNHPKQKPRDKFDRQSLIDLPLQPTGRISQLLSEIKSEVTAPVR